MPVCKGVSDSLGKALTEASKDQQTFGPVQHVHGDSPFVSTHLPHLMCHYQLSYQANKCYYWQHSHKTIIGAIDIIVLLCINPVNKSRN